jgi:hypothetical protein
LYRLYTLMANFRLFSSAMLFISISNIQKNTTEEKKKTKNREQRAEKREQRTEPPRSGRCEPSWR